MIKCLGLTVRYFKYYDTEFLTKDEALETTVPSL